MFSHMSGLISRLTRLERLLHLTRLSNRVSKTPFLSFSMSSRCQPHQILVPVSQDLKPRPHKYRIRHSRSRLISATRSSFLCRRHRISYKCITDVYNIERINLIFAKPYWLCFRNMAKLFKWKGKMRFNALNPYVSRKSSRNLSMGFGKYRISLAYCKPTFLGEI